MLSPAWRPTQPWVARPIRWSRASLALAAAAGSRRFEVGARHHDLVGPDEGAGDGAPAASGAAPPQRATSATGPGGGLLWTGAHAPVARSADTAGEVFVVRSRATSRRLVR